jgi:hypothetical protein
VVHEKELLVLGGLSGVTTVSALGKLSGGIYSPLLAGPIPTRNYWSIVECTEEFLVLSGLTRESINPGWSVTWNHNILAGFHEE